MNAKKTARFPGFGWWVMLLFVLLLLLVSSPYLSLDPETFFPQQRPVYEANLVWLMLHIAGSMVAALTGPFQFLPQLRRGRWPSLHRWLGRVYLLGVLTGGVGGLYMAFFAYGGWGARAGFIALALFWLYSAYRAYAHIRRKEVEGHRRWMTRNYALTFGAVNLRLGLGLLQVAGLGFEQSYQIMAWAAWVPNLLLVEWLMRRGVRARRVAG